jgi:leucyl aminopeptidase
MKKIIEVDVRTRRVEPVACKTDMLVVGRYSDSGPDEGVQALDRKLGGGIDRLARLGDFTGKPKTHAVLYGEGRLAAERVMLVGLGERKKATLDTLRKAAALAANRAVEMKVKRLSLALHRAFADRLDAAAVGRAMVEGVYLGSYRYDEFVAENGNGRLGSLNVEIVDGDSSRIKSMSPGITAGTIIGRAQSYARTMANRPANVIDPPALARAAQDLARGLETVRCTIFDEKKLQANRMGGILAVGAGSQSKPRLILLKYTPARKPAQGAPTIALVGKAITFDSGGISIKPAQDMDQMKLDKTGGIVVLATIRAIAELGLPVHVLGLVPSAENLPSGSSFRPGDIITTYSGKTVEILNTDAEGRMILCDALAYAARQKCDRILDIATLTGACMVALGTCKAGLMSNDDDLVRQIEQAAEDSGESVWRLPAGEEYAEEMKSKIADLKNAGSRWGGACTAAAFLQQFVGDAKWAHLDIAGMDAYLKPTEYAALGGTGFGVRLLTTYLMNLGKEKLGR